MSSNDTREKSHAPPRRNSSGRHPHFRSPSFAFVLLVVGSLYVTACALPAFVTSGGGERFNFGAAYSGLKCLMLGWLIPQHWIANIFLLMGLLLLGLGRPSAALAFGVLAIFASASMMIVFRPDGLSIGYYLWTSSMFFFAVGSLFFFLVDCLVGGQVLFGHRRQESSMKERA